ncbi:dimethylaniline monooxygenase (N-oxide forming) [Nitrobacteraceae bacterium AZCC 2161]
MPESRTSTTADICIIGAGSSGVAVAKALRDQGLSFDCFEKGSDVGGMWRYENDNGLSCAYRSLHIDTSRQTVGYPDFPIPDTNPDFLSHRQFLGYLEAYAERFEVRPNIRFNTEVKSVEKLNGGRWIVRTGNGEAREYSAVIIANGHLWDPRRPSFPGEFSGTAIHSREYRTADAFDGKSVLVVGIGNSAVDIAVDLCKRASSVSLSTRTGAYIMPKYMMGIPVDRWSTFFARKLRFPTLLTRMVMARLIYLAVGDQTRFGVPKPKHPMWREHATLSQELLPYVGHGWIDIKPNVAALSGDRVEFSDGTSKQFDAIIYAIGYKTTFPFLSPSIFSVKDGEPVDLYRRIVPPSQPGLYFAGLVQPIGPTIPLVEVQARWIASVLANKTALPSFESMKAEIDGHHLDKQRTWLNSARYTLEVDAKSYARNLRKDVAI